MAYVEYCMFVFLLYSWVGCRLAVAKRKMYYAAPSGESKSPPLLCSALTPAAYRCARLLLPCLLTGVLTGLLVGLPLLPLRLPFLPPLISLPALESRLRSNDRGLLLPLTSRVLLLPPLSPRVPGAMRTDFGRSRGRAAELPLMVPVVLASTAPAPVTVADRPARRPVPTGTRTAAPALLAG